MPDYMFLLESRLSPEQRAVMLRVQELSAALGFNVYLTGGTVRDLVTGASLRDLDFTVEGNPSRIAQELEKGGAKILSEDEKYRHVEVLFAGDCEGSISAARDDHYVRPGTRPEIRWSTIMEDLRRRDFSLNAIAISLNPASRGLLLDPTNGLSDIERGEVRALTIHSFTNQPVRLLRVLRFSSRMGFKLEGRTQEWFDLAIERELHKTISSEDAGGELRAVAREERPNLVLKAWEQHDFMEAAESNLSQREPGSDEAAKELSGRKMNAPIDAYRFLEKMPLDEVAFLLAESRNSAALSKIRAYLNKWRPVRIGLPGVAQELQTLGMERGAKFDAIVEQVFAMQLTGRGKTPEEREKILRKLSGIKEAPKKKEKKGAKAAEKGHTASAGKHTEASAAAAKAATQGHHRERLGCGKPAAKAAPPSRGKSAAGAKKSGGREEPRPGGHTTQHQTLA